MRDHYREFSHPVLVDLPLQPTTDLFTEMDEIADELRANPEHVEVDDQIAFCQLQRLRASSLSSGVEWLDLFDVWRLRYMARQEARRADVAKLWEERDALISERASLPPDERSRIDARLAEVARMLAAGIC